MNKQEEYSTIIIDSAVIVKELEKRLENLTIAYMDVSEIMDIVFSSIAIEDRAEDLLAKNCAKILEDGLGISIDIEQIKNSRIFTTYKSDVEELVSIVYDFGEKMSAEIKKLRAYKNGYLFYQFLRLIDKDIVLEKFEIPTIPETIPD